MTFGERLTHLRKENGYNTRNEFAEFLNIPSTTLRNYETDKREPGHTFLKQMSELFNVSVDYLLCLTDEKEVLHPFRLKVSEQEHIEKYRTLDIHGKDMVDTVLDKEYDRCLSSADQAHEERTEYNIIYLPYPENRASAGTGDEFLSDVTRSISVKENRLTIRADLVIKVDGNSMEPVYSDGDIVLVHQQPAVDIGAIGLYAANGKGYIKKQGKDRLISVNPDYPDIMPEKNYAYKCFGQVIGKLNPEWII